MNPLLSYFPSPCTSMDLTKLFVPLRLPTLCAVPQDCCLSLLIEYASLDGRLLLFPTALNDLDLDQGPQSKWKTIFSYRSWLVRMEIDTMLKQVNLQIFFLYHFRCENSALKGNRSMNKTKKVHCLLKHVKYELPSETCELLSFLSYGASMAINTKCYNLIPVLISLAFVQVHRDVSKENFVFIISQSSQFIRHVFGILFGCVHLM